MSLKVPPEPVSAEGEGRERTAVNVGGNLSAQEGVPYLSVSLSVSPGGLVVHLLRGVGVAVVNDGVVDLVILVYHLIFLLILYRSKLLVVALEQKTDKQVD